MLAIPIGVDDFRMLRDGGLVYVDKSALIRELLDRAGVQVVLLTRPRRFGKTLNLSMLRCWFEKHEEDLSRLFEGLAIWQAEGDYRAHFQRYPVIHLSFKDTKLDRFDPGVVLELKVARAGKKTLEQALAEGVAQLQAMDYAAELRAAGAAPVHAFAVAFDGKQVRVRSAVVERPTA